MNSTANETATTALNTAASATVNIPVNSIGVKAQPPVWSREIESAEINGYPVRRYRDRPTAVHQLLLNARRWADRELLVQGDRRLTFAEHEHAVAAVANRFAAYGIGRGDRVLIHGFNSIEWVVSFWALHSLGAVAALGNPWWSDSDVDTLVQRIQPKLAVTDRRLPSVVRIGFGEIRRIVDARVPTVLNLRPVDESDPAIIMFTSGTTGLPKGIVVPQRSVIGNLHNLLASARRLPGDLADDFPASASLQAVPLFHLAGVQVSCATVLQGGKLVMLDGKFDPTEVLRLIEQERVTSFGAIPTMVSRILDHPDIATRDLSSLRSIPLGGAPVTAELRERISLSFPNVKRGVGSLYGLTDTGGLLASASGAEVMGHPGRVGRPLPVIDLRIADPDEKGEGEVLARTPNAPTEIIGDGPVADADGWIATGDLGRIDDQGYLYITGRAKEIIIRGGENIGAPHVEEQLETHPDVLSVGVVGIPDTDLGEIVGAVVRIRRGADQLPPAELVDHLRDRLGRHEIPERWWLRTDSLPMTAVGKLDKKTLLAQWAAQDFTDRWPDRDPNHRSGPDAAAPAALTGPSEPVLVGRSD